MQELGLEKALQTKVNYVGGPTLAIHLPHQGYGTVGCTQMVYLVLPNELMAYCYPQSCGEAGSSSDSVQASRRWTSPVQKFKTGEVATSSIGVAGGRSETPPYTRAIERNSVKAEVASPSFGSPSSLSELGHRESTSRSHPIRGRHLSSRRYHMSKAVYPLMFHNPVSDYETFTDVDGSDLDRLTPGEDHVSPSYWHENNPENDDRFHRNPTDLHKSETSPDPSASSRRDGFRWSSASSYDLGFDGERGDVVDNVVLESLTPPRGPNSDQKCGVCGKLLSQKSPWSSHRILRGNDMPVAGVLPCSHVFHADCLEHMTPKGQIQDPPCPVCLKYGGVSEESESVYEPLEMALRSLRRSRGTLISQSQYDHEDKVLNHIKERPSRKWPRVVPRWSIGSASIKRNLKKHFSIRRKATDDFCETKATNGASSSTSL